MSPRGLRAQAVELSRRWHELSGLLASRRLLASLYESAQLTPTKLRALDLLAESGSLRVGELAERVGIEETTATRLVDRLEDVGVAERRGSPGDRRVTVVGLTPAGEQLVAEIVERRERLFTDVLAELEPAERAELVRLTAKAADVLRSRSEELVRR